MALFSSSRAAADAAHCCRPSAVLAQVLAALGAVTRSSRLSTTSSKVGGLAMSTRCIGKKKRVKTHNPHTHDTHSRPFWVAGGGTYLCDELVRHATLGVGAQNHLAGDPAPAAVVGRRVRRAFLAAGAEERPEHAAGDVVARHRAAAGGAQWYMALSQSASTYPFIMSRCM